MWSNTMNSNEIGDRVSKLTSTARDGVTTATDAVSDLAGKGWTAAVDAGDTVQAAAVGVAKQISDTAAIAYRQGLLASRYVRQNTAEQPFAALLIAGAIGFAIAYILYRR
jgi:hypothetical protein